jgi:EAL domain-containing protein (putative c-di-GMP-specific phosphodiesterase class I)
VLEQAWSDQVQWRENQQAEIAMSVNVSAHQFMSAGFAKSVAAVLDATATEPGQLTLEVTESVFVRDEERRPDVHRQAQRRAG